jgi:hypothetical protein
MQSTQTTSSTLSTERKTPASLHVITTIILILLAAEFLIGMLVNLFVTVPSAHPGVNPSNYFVGVAQAVVWALFNAPWQLLIHVVVGLLLFLLSIVLLVLAIVSRRGAWITISALGLIGIMGAGFNGASFMNYGGPNISSLLMAIGFLLAAVSYTIGLSMRR